jgi:hypothetical protein
MHFVTSEEEEEEEDRVDSRATVPANSRKDVRSKLFFVAASDRVTTQIS